MLNIKNKIIKLLFVLFLSFFGVMFYIVAKSGDNKDLKAIETKIKNLERRIVKLRKTEKTLYGELEATENEISYLNEIISELNAKKELLIEQEKKTKVRIDVMNDNLAVKRKKIGALLRKIYIYENFYKYNVLFSGNDWLDILRILFYLNFVNKSNLSELDNYIASKNKLNIELEKMRKKREELDKTIEEKEKKKANLSYLKTKKKRLLAKIMKNKKKYERNLRKNKKKYEALNDVLKKLNMQKKKIKKQNKKDTNSITKKNTKSKNNVHYKFSKLKGKLPYPVKGKITSFFGVHKDRFTGTSIKNNGIDIKCKANSAIKSVAFGKVVIATSTPQSGNIVIIEHDNSYYSVYAYLGEIVVNVNDTVKQGDILAYSIKKVDSVIHFEIRYGKKPLNPLSWLKHK